METAGRGNSIETDILRVSYVGNFSMAGTYPYALVQGRISSQKGELGTKKQAYAIRRMDIKWLNTPMEEGDVQLEANKRLARNCEAGTLDSCNITTRLTGELSDLQFTYDSDCEGASGAGVEVSALVYSVRRGCYSSALRGGGSGLSYSEQALGLLEPVASSYLTDAVGKLSGHWISSAQVTGLSALASDNNRSDSNSTRLIHHFDPGSHRPGNPEQGVLAHAPARQIRLRSGEHGGQQPLELPGGPGVAPAPARVHRRSPLEAEAQEQRERRGRDLHRSGPHPGEPRGRIPP